MPALEVKLCRREKTRFPNAGKYAILLLRQKKEVFRLPLSILPSFLLYCYITAITPGPANLCSLSTAMHYGRSVALKQWRGLVVGFVLDCLIAVFVCRVLGGVLGSYVQYLSWVGAAYILWMAWHMLRASGTAPEADERAPGFRTGLIVNLTNAKVILFCITALSSFVLPYTDSFWWLLGVGLLLPLTGPVCNLVWLFAGEKLKALFSNHQKAADIIMAAALALCAVNLVLPK